MDRNVVEEAVRRVIAGDREAFREVVRATATVVRSYAGFFLADASLIDDVIQEVYVQVYKELPEYDPGTEFMAWVKAKTKYAALAQRRKLGRTASARQRYLRRVAERVSEQAEAREREHLLEGKLAALRKCLATLSKRVRCLIDLRYFKGLSLEEVGRQAGMKRPAVSTAIHRARAALATCVEREGS
jgi:RNA polymerase sigma-70 factor (ECF subfamily)